MFTTMILTALLAGPQPRTTHVRSSDAKIAASIEAGIAQSATFRRLVDMLNESDVIVYIDLKRTHDGLDAFMSHGVLTRGGYRYVRIAFDPAGSPRRQLSILAHELQHAVEVSQAPDARDERSTELMFRRIGIEMACGHTDCSETRAALAIQASVNEELSPARSSAPLQMSRR